MAHDAQVQAAAEIRAQQHQVFVLSEHNSSSSDTTNDITKRSTLLLFLKIQFNVFRVKKG